MNDLFDDAAYYTCREPDTLTIRSPEEAIEEWFEPVMVSGCDASEVIRKYSPIIVRAFNKKYLSEAWIESVAEDLLYVIEERFHKEYGNPEDRCIIKSSRQKAMSWMITAIMEFISDENLGQCEKVGEREYSAEQVEAVNDLSLKGEA